MRENEGTFEGDGGCRLHWKLWRPEQDPARGILVLVHGAGEHIYRYENLVDSLVPAGYIVAGFDLRGHGRSEGKRGHINSWDEYRNDLHLFLDLLERLHPGLPVFLFGHSMGSLIALDYLVHHQEGIAGAVISGTALEPAEVAPLHLKLIAKGLSRVAPQYTLTMKIEGDSLSSLPEIAQAYEKDPLVHYERTTRWGSEGMKVISQIEKNASKITLPVIFIHGEKDRLCTVSGVQKYFDRILSEDKTLHIYSGRRHETHNDLNHEEVLDEVRSWLDRHI